MLKWLFKKTMLSDMDDNVKDYAVLLKDRIVMVFLAEVSVRLILILPLISFIALGIGLEFTLINETLWCVLLIAHLIWLIYFHKMFLNEIERFKEDVAIKLYNRYFLRKGKALKEEDFKKIEQDNSELYYYITRLKARGYCYPICFNLLKILKKGKMIYLAVCENTDENGNTRTMHVLYVNDEWCYDTFCQNQLPLQQVLKLSKGIIYKEFSYDDIKNRDYNTFRIEEASSLKAWCKNNNCYEKFGVNDETQKNAQI